MRSLLFLAAAIARSISGCATFTTGDRSGQLLDGRPGRFLEAAVNFTSSYFSTPIAITRLVGNPTMLAHYFQIEEGELKTKAVTDPRAAVAVDVASLRAIPALPREWLISGLVYDVATGLVEVVVPGAPIRAAAP